VSDVLIHKKSAEPLVCFAVYDAVKGIPQADNDLEALVVMHIYHGMAGEKGDHIASKI
jgi:hypothetical protein